MSARVPARMSAHQIPQATEAQMVTRDVDSQRERDKKKEKHKEGRSERIREIRRAQGKTMRKRNAEIEKERRRR